MRRIISNILFVWCWCAIQKSKAQIYFTGYTWPAEAFSMRFNRLNFIVPKLTEPAPTWRNIKTSLKVEWNHLQQVVNLKTICRDVGNNKLRWITICDTIRKLYHFTFCSDICFSHKYLLVEMAQWDIRTRSKLLHSITVIRGVRNTERCFSHACTVSHQTSIGFRNKRKRENVLCWSLTEISTWSHQIYYTFWAGKFKEKVVI